MAVTVRSSRMVILTCLALILIFPFFSVPVQGSYRQLAPSLGTVGARVLTESAIWCYALATLVIALRGEPRTLAGIGLRRPSWAAVLTGLAGALAMLIAGQSGNYLDYTMLRAPARSDTQAVAIVSGSVIYALCLAIRAGVVEELLFRGLAIEQLTTLTGRRWLAACISGLTFVLVHALRFDLAQLVPIAAVTIVLTGLYLWRRNLLANIVAHVFIDSIGLVGAALSYHG